MSSDLPGFRFQQQSVVVLDPAISPLTINLKSLTDSSVIPGDWQHRDAVSTPPLALLNYRNGVSLRGEPGKLTISEPLSDAPGPTSQIHDLAIAYVTAFRPPTYQALGLNWNLSMVRDKAQEWLTRTFLADAAWRKATPEVIRMNPSLTFRTKAAECNLQFAPGSPTNDAEPQETVVITCNFHHQGPFDLATLRARIEDWPARRTELLAILRSLG